MSKRDADAEPSNAAKRYKKYTQREHALMCPGMYVDSPQPELQNVWGLTFDDAQTPSLSMIDVVFAPALFKIFDEVLTNALDASVKDVTITKIAVTVSDTHITVRNDGNGEKGIPVEKSAEYDEWVPGMIFGQLLTSSNYDGDRDGVAGTNGLGVKLANIYSDSFSVKVKSAVSGAFYEQEWTDSMSSTRRPKIKSGTKPGPGFVEVCFQPLGRLLDGGVISDGLRAVLAKRALDVALAARKDVKLTFNGMKLPTGNLRAYVKMLVPDATATIDESDPNWRVALVYSESPSVHGLVNGVSSVGKHVLYAATNIAAALAPKVKAKRGGKDVSVKTTSLLAASVMVAVCTVKNPLWTSQVKHELKTCEYKTRYKPADEFIDKLAAGPIAAAIIRTETQKVSETAGKKTDGKKVVNLNIPKLRDATFAGTAKSKKCVLILTEGDSALTFAVSALQNLGFDTHGAFPLRGVPINVRDASEADISKNVEIAAIKQIVGLKKGVDSFDGLRYGKIWLCTDQDADGAHIRGLVINFLHHGWPNLVRDGLIEVIPTPIIRARRGAMVKDFYSIQEFERFDHAGWHASYFKGLGSWTSADAREIFKKTKPARFIATDETEESLVLAFGQKKRKTDEKTPPDRRKDWIYQGVADPPLSLTYGEDVPIERFISTDYLLFCMYAIKRAIAQISDGLGRAQVKIMHTVLDGGFTDSKHQIKVAQLGARVAERTAYLHGEVSLFGGIINMGQSFTGSNNVPLLFAAGQFGSRLGNGKDRASPRYIHTYATPAALALFRKADAPIYRHMTEEGQKVEPETLLPLLPVILLNGSEAIAIGFSSTIPAFDPKVVLENVRRELSGDALVEMHPWYRGFGGTIEPHGNGYKVAGLWEERSDGTVLITELPVGASFNDFADNIKKDAKSNFIVAENRSTGEKPHFVLRYKTDEDRKEVAEKGVDKVLKLVSYISLNNMYAFDTSGKLKKYATPEEILREFVAWRLERYAERKAHELARMAAEISVFSNKARFVLAVASREIDIAAGEEQELRDTLEAMAFDRMDGSFDYLLNISMRMISKDRAKQLTKQKDAAVVERDELAAKEPSAIWLEELVDVEKRI